MAAATNETPVLSSAFPLPPPFHTHFTEASLSALAARRSTSTPGPLPAPLHYLVPPPPPKSPNTRYRSFGDYYNLDARLPSLAEQGIEQLYTSPVTPSLSQPADTTSTTAAAAATAVEEDSSWRTSALSKISKSLLVNFLELVGVLSVDPSQYGPKIEHLRTLFINAHHLLNEYRPHQARETLILMMEEQLAATRAETARLREAKASVEDALKDLDTRVRDVIREAGGNIAFSDGGGTTTTARGEMEGGDGYYAEGNDKEEERGKRMWEALDSNLLGAC
ncbi:MAG: hypothetical protein M1825_001912 [Sarcosagium campestre]|nr:MAG: hypothetical protein M1825_001912 [Sarcosagium campestre]